MIFWMLRRLPALPRFQKPHAISELALRKGSSFDWGSVSGLSVQRSLAAWKGDSRLTVEGGQRRMSEMGEESDVLKNNTPLSALTPIIAHAPVT